MEVDNADKNIGRIFLCEILGTGLFIYGIMLSNNPVTFLNSERESFRAKMARDNWHTNYIPENESSACTDIDPICSMNLVAPWDEPPLPDSMNTGYGTSSLISRENPSQNSIVSRSVILILIYII